MLQDLLEKVLDGGFIFHEGEDGGSGTGEGESTTQDEQETPKEPFKSFANEDEYNNAIKSERSKAKNELMKELGIKSVDEAKETFNKYATLQSEFETTKAEHQKLSEEIVLTKAGVKDDYKEEVITLARAKVSDEMTFEKAIEAVIEKMPMVIGKGFQGRVGTQSTQEENDNSVQDKLSKHYPWLKK